jgi:hypothetical protein
MGFGFGILVLALLGRSMLRASGTGMRMRVSRRGKGAGGILMVALALVVIGGIGVVLSRLIKAAVSRQREVLADASAVQFTREPMALAGALKKIGGFSPYIEHAETEEVSHMLFGRAGKSFTGLFATHPPLPDRIRALDPSFEPGDYIASEPGLSAETPGEAAGISRFQGGGEITIESAGTIEPEAGSALRAAIPADILDVAHSSQSAWLLVLALGLERGGGSAAEQRILENQIGADRTGRCLALHRQIETLDAGLRLPLFELAVPALKARPPEEIEYLFELLEKLAAADGELSLFEYLLQRLLRTYLFPLETHRSSATKIRAAELVLIGVLAVEGHEDATRARTAFSAGISALNIPAGPETEAAFDRALGARDFDALDQALTDLTGAGARERRSALVALVATLRHDQRTTLAEAELFRTIAATLGCPVPPGGVTG